MSWGSLEQVPVLRSFLTTLPLLSFETQAHSESGCTMSYCTRVAKDADLKAILNYRRGDSVPSVGDPKASTPACAARGPSSEAWVELELSP